MKTKDLCQCGSTDNRVSSEPHNRGAMFARTSAKGFYSGGDGPVRSADGFFFYRISYEIHPLVWLTEGAVKSEWDTQIYTAMRALHEIMRETLLNDKISTREALDLFNELAAANNAEPPIETFDAPRVERIQTALTRFENVLSSDLSRLDLFIVLTKNGFNTRTLIYAGEKCFPSLLIKKVPECLFDVRDAMKCIALSLPTAAGFHLHRANESVLHRYWDKVTDGAPRPTMGNGRPASMGKYLEKLEELKAGDEKVRAAMKSLKDLHRNPLSHPELSLETVEEAIALHGAVNSVIVEMLKVIPDNSPAEMSPSGLALTSDDRVIRDPNV